MANWDKWFIPFDAIEYPLRVFLSCSSSQTKSNAGHAVTEDYSPNHAVPRQKVNVQ